jgi:hypothetical protein
LTRGTKNPYGPFDDELVSRDRLRASGWLCFLSFFTIGKDLDAGKITEDHACELLVNLWIKTFTINKIRRWGSTLLPTTLFVPVIANDSCFPI